MVPLLQLVVWVTIATWITAHMDTLIVHITLYIIIILRTIAGLNHPNLYYYYSRWMANRPKIFSGYHIKSLSICFGRLYGKNDLRMTVTSMKRLRHCTTLFHSKILPHFDTDTNKQLHGMRDVPMLLLARSFAGHPRTGIGPSFRTKEIVG